MVNENEGRKKTYDGSDDQSLLLVKGASGSKSENTTYVKTLATAISTVFQKHNVVKLRCIGKGATANAVYAHAIARGEVAKQGVDLRCMPIFQTVSFGEGVERTAMLLELRDSEDAQEPEREEYEKDGPDPGTMD